jgi:hypothetical protein
MGCVHQHPAQLLRSWKALGIAASALLPRKDGVFDLRTSRRFPSPLPLPIGRGVLAGYVTLITGRANPHPPSLQTCLVNVSRSG